MPNSPLLQLQKIEVIVVEVLKAVLLLNLAQEQKNFSIRGLSDLHERTTPMQNKKCWKTTTTNFRSGKFLDMTNR